MMEISNNLEKLSKEFKNNYGDDFEYEDYFKNKLCSIP